VLFRPHRLADGAADVGVLTALPQVPGVVTAVAHSMLTSSNRAHNKLILDFDLIQPPQFSL